MDNGWFTYQDVNDYRDETLLALIPGLILGAIFGLQSRILETKKVPNQGIKLTMRNGFILALLIALIICIPLALFVSVDEENNISS